jgi:hypothetical protein
MGCIMQSFAFCPAAGKAGLIILTGTQKYVNSGIPGVDVFAFFKRVVINK